MDIRELPNAVGFKEAATCYCWLLERHAPDAEQWVVDVLGALARLYACGCALPALGLPENAPDVRGRFEITVEERLRVSKVVRDVLGPQDKYWAYYDPSDPPDSGHEPCFNILSDDLADIYGDVKPGVMAWESGVDEYLPSVVFEWKDPLFFSHWGVHAVSAMRALHPIAYWRGVQRREQKTAM